MKLCHTNSLLDFYESIRIFFQDWTKFGTKSHSALSAGIAEVLRWLASYRIRWWRAMQSLEILHIMPYLIMPYFDQRLLNCPWKECGTTNGSWVFPGLGHGDTLSEGRERDRDRGRRKERKEGQVGTQWR